MYNHTSHHRWLYYTVGSMLYRHPVYSSTTHYPFPTTRGEI